MKVRFGLMAFFLFCCGLFSLSAAGFGRVGEVKSSVPPYPLDITGYGHPWVTDDRNNDGIPDHAVQIDKAGRTGAEAFDFNFDGRMDDFYLYEGGAIVMEMLDTNYDGAIDLWVSVYQGVYVAGYERDKDYDGKLDLVKQFGRDNLVKR